MKAWLLEAYNDWSYGVYSLSFECPELTLRQRKLKMLWYVLSQGIWVRIYVTLACKALGHDVLEEDASESDKQNGHVVHYCKRCGHVWEGWF